MGWVGEMWASVWGGKGEGVRHHVAVTTGTYPPQSPGQGIMRRAGGGESQGVRHKAQRHVSSR